MKMRRTSGIRSLAGFLLVAALSAAMMLPALANNLYGAIAISPSTGKVSGSWNFRNQSAANTRAISRCNALTNGAGDCIATVAVHQHLCGALATDSVHGTWRGGVANTRAAAKSAALSNLGSSNGRIAYSLCNSGNQQSAGASSTESAVAGLLVGAAAVALLTHHPHPAATASVYVPAPVAQDQTAYVPGAQTSVPQSANSSQYTPVGPSHPLALVGVKVHASDVINAILPIYASIDGNVVQSPVLGQIVGGTGGTETVYQPAGYVLTGLDVYRGSYKGNDEVVGMRVYWSKLLPEGIASTGEIESTIMASSPPGLTIKTLRAPAGEYISNLVLTPSTHPDGSTYIHDIAIVTTRL
ncbi:MAG TPA: DUF4189 domain-containing protein [Candidatus Dormibacteraeota bacterium]|nr:DUF4189 domain-containing protein [Candidatus Dormibacteraeota bacterium]